MINTSRSIQLTTLLVLFAREAVVAVLQCSCLPYLDSTAAVVDAAQEEQAVESLVQVEEEILDSEAVVVPEEERTDLPEVEEQIPDQEEEGNDSWWLKNNGQDGNKRRQ